MATPRVLAALAAAAAVTVSLSACARHNLVPASGNRDFITADEIEASGVRNASEAIRYHFRHLQRGRSSLLLEGGLVVVLDGVRISDAKILVGVPAWQIESIQYLSGPDATVYYGTNAGDGAVLIYTKRGPDS